MAFDFDAAVLAPFRMQPGLRRLAPGAQQLQPNSAGSRHLHEKIAALSRQPPSALQCAAGFDATPALHALAQHAADEHPAAFSWQDGTASAHTLGLAVRSDGAIASLGQALPAAQVCLERLPAHWRLSALLALAFAEDFAVIDGRSANIPWLAVALPSFWAPEEKIGRHFAQVHAPVADNQLLVAAGDALARLVSAETRWERFVWTVTPHAELDAHPDRAMLSQWQPGDADSMAAQAWWRTERQTFIPLPDQQQAVFTILTDSQPLVQAIDSAQRAQRLHAAIATMSDAVLRYRNLHGVRDTLLQWLAQRAGQ